MKPTLTLLLALLLIFIIGLLYIPFAITAMVIVSGFIYIVRQCKELSENRFGKKTEL